MRFPKFLVPAHVKRFRKWIHRKTIGNADDAKCKAGMMQKPTRKYCRNNCRYGLRDGCELGYWTK